MRNTHVYPITKEEVIEVLQHELQKYMEFDAPIGGPQASCLGIAIALVEKSDFVDDNTTPVR